MKTVIQLSTKVIDSEYRLKKTLLHECCHVAQFVLEREFRPPHGRAFWKWARIATRRFPDLPVETCHSYDVHYKCKYQCTACGKMFGRHSKSLDTARYRCKCGGRIVYLGMFDPDGRRIAEKVPTPYNRFVKERYESVRAEMPPGTPNAKVLQRVAQIWKDRKNRSDGSDNE
ncbi:unnamed protein product [Vitrella brassicaformis CCMP3155]|uniref:SprT-like domain-containing protein n=1 Tax=Vitrella brassicaformis (strain CCMP3155) TaxID=1169540 RepID=A0A0G4EXA1_VITBC|nr:unnamed protein product [Vitrella brassicaformis CCMP3155]|eukprot:CEM02720.1 unnamed protein product [Vitrella brassicaformis CCMP3155]